MGEGAGEGTLENQGSGELRHLNSSFMSTFPGF